VAERDWPQIEERLLEDRDSFEELTILEEELIDQYLRGELSSADRNSFEERFLLMPERQEKLRFARAFQKYLTEAEAATPVAASPVEEASEHLEVTEPPPRPPGFFLPFRNPVLSYALAAAILLVVGGLSWLAVKNWRAPQTGQTMAVVLTPGLTRGGDDAKAITISPDVGTVNLQLALPENRYQTYEAALLNADGQPLATSKNLPAGEVDRRPTVTFEISSPLVPPGDYRVRLTGTTTTGNSESVASYSFRVLQAPTK